MACKREKGFRPCPGEWMGGEDAEGLRLGSEEGIPILP